MDFVTLPKVGLPYLHLHSVSHAALSLKYVWLPSFPCHIIRLRASCTATAPLEVEHVCKVYPYIPVRDRLSATPLSFVPFSVHSLHFQFVVQMARGVPKHSPCSDIPILCFICKPYLFSPALSSVPSLPRPPNDALAVYPPGYNKMPILRDDSSLSLVAGYPRRLTNNSVCHPVHALPEVA